MTIQPPSTTPPPITDPSTPNPQLVALVFRLLRCGLTLLSGVGITVGASLNSDATLMIVASALVGLGTAVWTIIEWIRNARHTHASVLASVALARPVQVS